MAPIVALAGAPCRFPVLVRLAAGQDARVAILKER
jgi:hypothetical protein